MRNVGYVYDETPSTGVKALSDSFQYFVSNLGKRAGSTGMFGAAISCRPC